METGQFVVEVKSTGGDGLNLKMVVVEGSALLSLSISSVSLLPNNYLEFGYWKYWKLS